MLVLSVQIYISWIIKFSKLQLETVNKNLEAYYDAWYKYVKSWIIIKIHDPSYVYQWRLQVRFVISSTFLSVFHIYACAIYLTRVVGCFQAEIAMRADGNPGMSDEEVKIFICSFSKN